MGGAVLIGVSVIIVSDTVVGGLSVGGGAVLPLHPTILTSIPQQRRSNIILFIYLPPFPSLALHPP